MEHFVINGPDLHDLLLETGKTVQANVDAKLPPTDHQFPHDYQHPAQPSTNQK